MQERNMSIFEKYLTLWVLLCIGAGILIGKVAPGMGYPARTAGGLRTFCKGRVPSANGADRIGCLLILKGFTYLTISHSSFITGCEDRTEKWKTYTQCRRVFEVTYQMSTAFQSGELPEFERKIICK